MSKIQINKLLVAGLGLLVMGVASAKLPPLSDEAKEKAAEAKNKTAWNDKVAGYQLCLAQNKVAATYLKQNDKPKPTIEVPPCVNPGPYVALPVAPPTAPAAAPVIAGAVATDVKPLPVAADAKVSPATVKK